MRERESVASDPLPLDGFEPAAFHARAGVTPAQHSRRSPRVLCRHASCLPPRKSIEASSVTGSKGRSRKFRVIVESIAAMPQWTKRSRRNAASKEGRKLLQAECAGGACDPKMQNETVRTAVANIISRHTEFRSAIICTPHANYGREAAHNESVTLATRRISGHRDAASFRRRNRAASPKGCRFIPSRSGVTGSSGRAWKLRTAAAGKKSCQQKLSCVFAARRPPEKCSAARKAQKYMRACARRRSWA